MKANAEDKKLKAFYTKKRLNAELDSLLSGLKTGGLYNDDEDSNTMSE